MTHPTPGVHARPCFPRLPAQMLAVGRAPHAGTAANSDPAPAWAGAVTAPGEPSTQTSGASAQRLGSGPPGGPEPRPGGKRLVMGERRTPGPCRPGTRMPHLSGGREACRVTPGAGALCPGRPGAGLGT